MVQHLHAEFAWFDLAADAREDEGHLAAAGRARAVHLALEDEGDTCVAPTVATGAKTTPAIAHQHFHVVGAALLHRGRRCRWHHATRERHRVEDAPEHGTAPLWSILSSGTAMASHGKLLTYGASEMTLRARICS